jgi:hypothetical protein
MKNAKQNLIYASCVAAGLFMAAAGAQAADRDVSEIYGRAAPALTGPDTSTSAQAGSWQGDRFQAVSEEQPVTTQVPQDRTHAAAPNERAPDRASATSSSDSEITPTGQYLAVEDPPERFAYQGYNDEGDRLAYRRDDEAANLEGMPLVEGRGMREGVEFQPVTTDPLYGVEEILGRASPPAPADHPDYILHV